MDMPLPKSWAEKTLREICEPTKLWNPQRDARDEFWYIDVSAVSRESFAIREPQRIKGIEAPSRARKIVQSGDAIFATVRPTLRRVAFVSPEFNDQIASTAFCVVRANREKASPRFLYYLLLTDFLNEEIAKFESGANYPAVNDKDVLDRIVPLPPKPEQEKIAAVLWKVQCAIEVEDKLIATARELKQSAMRQLFTCGLRSEPQKETDYGALPDSWPTQPLGLCCVVQTGVTKGRKIPPEEALEVPYLRVANVQDGHLDLREMKTIIIRRDELEGYLLQDGDVVLTEGGDFDKLGRGFIWRGEVANCVHQNHIFAVRANRAVLLPEFLAYLVQSPYGRSYFLTVAHKTTNLACINATKLKAFPVPLPPRDEQREIVSILETIDRKISVHKRKRATLQELFKTLLHQLMTGQIRVHDLDVDVSEVAEC